MSKFLTKIKDWFTDALGALMMISSLVLTYTGSVVFIWDGLIILIVGFILMTIPDGQIAEAIKKWADKKYGDNDKK